MKLFFTLTILAVFSAVCMSVPQTPVSSAPSNAAKPAVPVVTGNAPKQNQESTEESADSECGPVHGKCPDNLCCSLHNECGKSTAHCNVSLGCKRKWGVCH